MGIHEVKLSASRGLRLRQDTAYPEESSIVITIEAAPEGPATIRLRIPAWCENPVLQLNGAVFCIRVE
jgi:hypothetical protein